MEKLIDPIILTYKFSYKTGRQERIVEDTKYYDDDEYMWVIHKSVAALYEEDEIAYHYSGKIEILNKTGWFSQFENFKYVHDSIIELVKYLVDGKYLAIKECINHHKGYRLTDRGHVDFNIETVISVISYADVYDKNPYYQFRFMYGTVESLEDIETNYFTFYYKFSKYLYNIDENLCAKNVFNKYLTYIRIKEPETYHDRVKAYCTKSYTYPTEDMFDEIYDKSTKAVDAKRDLEIEELNEKIAQLEKLKYKTLSKAFDL